MAIVYQTTTTGQFTVAGFTEPLPNIASSVTTTGNHFDRHLEHVTTTAANLNISSSIGAPGIIVLYNTDLVNFVEVGHNVSGFSPLFKLAPGDPPTQIRYDGVTLQLRANTAAVDVAVLILEA